MPDKVTFSQPLEANTALYDALDEYLCGDFESGVHFGVDDAEYVVLVNDGALGEILRVDYVGDDTWVVHTVDATEAERLRGSLDGTELAAPPTPKN